MPKLARVGVREYISLGDVVKFARGRFSPCSLNPTDKQLLFRALHGDDFSLSPYFSWVTDLKKVLDNRPLKVDNNIQNKNDGKLNTRNRY